MMVYQKEGLCQRARELGYDVTPRMVLDWTSLGLLDSPTRKGLGRGQGAIATWPESQLRLFIALLQHRGDVAKKSLVALCNLPVWLWLDWGDEYVPLRQVKRAFTTWIGRAMGGSQAKGATGARQVVDALRPLGATKADQMKLVSALTRLYYRRHTTFDRAKLRPLVEAVINPQGGQEALGPVGARLSPDIYLDLIEARLLVAKNVESIADGLWYNAQAMYRLGMQTYAMEQPGLAADPLLGHLHSRPDLNVLVNSACSNLMTTLGVLLLNERKRR